jgi:hypothetical protein
MSDPTTGQSITVQSPDGQSHTFDSEAVYAAIERALAECDEQGRPCVDAGAVRYWALHCGFDGVLVASPDPGPAWAIEMARIEE